MSSIEAHSKCYGTTQGAAAYAWKMLDEDNRVVMATHVAKALHWGDLTSSAFIELARKENFDSEHPTFRDGVPYLALCYWHVSGRYDAGQFAANYKAANSF